MDKEYVVFINVLDCDDYGLKFTFNHFDDAVNFLQLSLDNGYECTIYKNEMRDDNG